MFFSIASSILMAGVAGYSYLQTSSSPINDTEKIKTIFRNSGWIGANGETMRLHRKSKFKNGTEYVFQLPLGFDRNKIESNKQILEDGLNTRHKYLLFQPSDLLTIKLDKTILRQIKTILTTKKISKKEVVFDFDGMLRIKVYNSPMPPKIEWNESMLLKNFKVIVGYTREGKPIVHDFDKAKHLIIAGATGYGKSVAMKLFVTSLIHQEPINTKLSLIDLKGGSAFHRYKDCKQVEYYARDPKEAEQTLKKIQERMNSSFKKVVDNGYKDVKEAGIKERHFVFIDEAADLADYPQAMEIITDIARRGRSAGYYLVFCTQYPTIEVIPSQTKRNIIARLCYVLDTSIASNVVLDEAGAEDLPDIPGRGIYKNLRSTIVQTPFMTNKQIEKVITSHINIRPRKEDESEQNNDERAEDRKHTFIFEENGLSHSKTNTKNTQSRWRKKR
ncbi:AAA family ATPase [Cytobacillus oceanisediminis]|uniref:FtsK/SpoIIIE domain-containing protein n=1 Tax=Cytobacillus oceanisediminis TaxID=665099 RepID=UPI001CC9D508|nr:FtsK/SpoIIIE domain-containing protein [Cytobacillus oceanisediminis]MBQ6447026.1 AAA family ATPase [Bacillus sp. (in: firmicutes)]MBZ9535685.1 AAA family ATPase [Cytobacillus oceanisediminis]